MVKIATLTMNPAIDISANVGNIIPESKNRCSFYRNEPGGGGINVSRAIKRLGGSSTAFYLLGKTNGERLKVLLRREGIRQRPVRVKSKTRENITILEESSMIQYRFIMPGEGIAKTEWKSCLKEISSLKPNPDYMVASGSLPKGVPVDFYARLNDVMREKNIKFIVDSSGEALRLAIESRIYMAKPNLREFRQIAGADKKKKFETKDFAEKIIKRGQAEVLIISMGEKGALVFTKDGEEHFKIPSVTTNSKIGAGDSMMGAVVFAMAKGKNAREAVRFGVAAGTAATMTPGTELCRREDVMRLYRKVSPIKGSER